MLEPLWREKPDLTILADTRSEGSEAGLLRAFGVASYPGSVLYANAEWLDGHRDAAGKLAKAIKGALRWAREHPPEQALEKPQGVYHAQDRSMLLAALQQHNRDPLA